MLIASSTCLPRTMLATMRTLRDDSRACRSLALASIVSSPLLLRCRGGRSRRSRRRCARSARCARPRRARSPRSARSARCTRSRRLALTRVAAEGPRRGELAELVADHVLGDEHRNELLAVVHGEGQLNHLGQNRRAPRPGLDDLLVLGLALFQHLLEQVLVHERALLD